MFRVTRQASQAMTYTFCKSEKIEETGDMVVQRRKKAGDI
jgi:hypothetical protein